MANKLDPVTIIKEYSSELVPESTGLEPELTKLTGIRAVMFDVYGTLFQSGVGDISLAEKSSDKAEREKVIRGAIRDVGFRIQDENTPIAELFMDTIRAERDIRREQGVDHPEVDVVGVWEDLLGQLEAYEVIAGRPVNKGVLQRLACLYEAQVNPCWPMPGVSEAIEAVLDKSLSLGIISNAQNYTKSLFDAFLGDSPHDLGFEEILCIWSYEHTIGKPSTKLYEIATERLQALNGIAPEEVFYIGNDMRNDIWPAQKLGFKTGLFAGDKRSLRLRKDDEDCKDVQPDVVLTSLDQVAECLG